jgi:hypothetical protein
MENSREVPQEIELPYNPEIPLVGRDHKDKK